MKIELFEKDITQAYQDVRRLSHRFKRMKEYDEKYVRTVVNQAFIVGLVLGALIGITFFLIIGKGV